MSNYSQNGGILDDVEPGKRVKDAISKVRGSGSTPDMSQASEMVPDNPGPAMAGRTPAIGQARRERDLPVIRDQVPSLLD